MGDTPYSAYNVIVPPGHELVLKDSATRELRPRFFMMSNSAMELMTELDLNSHWLLWKLIALRCLDSNVAVLPFKSLTAAEYGRVKRGYLVLKKHGLVKRVAPETYQLNPEYVLPRQGYYKVRQEWEASIEQ